MAAFSAKRLVWSAISPITLAMLPMSCERWRSARICADEPCTALGDAPISSAAVRPPGGRFPRARRSGRELCFGLAGNLRHLLDALRQLLDAGCRAGAGVGLALGGLLRGLRGLG